MTEKMKKNIKVFMIGRKKYAALFFSLLILTFVFFNIKEVFAQVAQTTQSQGLTWGGAGAWFSGALGGAVASVIGIIALLIVSAVGLFTTLLIQVLINIAGYSAFTSAGPVIAGWVIIRDLCNMFFILILLVIAFATILRVESYNVKKTLPKLLIMAVLINFSKTIFGLITDAGQVVMMTFVNAFSQGAGAMVNALNLAKLLSGIPSNVNTENGWSNWIVAASVILAVIAVIVTAIVLMVMIAVLVVRIVMIWIYTILSPLVFLGFAFPPIAKYTGQVWQDFIKQVIVGPVLAFFIWLALTTGNSIGATGVVSQPFCGGLSSFFCDDSFQKFILEIGLLMGGMMVAQQMGGAAASIAGKGLNWAKAVAGSPLKLGQKMGGFGVDWVSQKAGIDFNVFRGIQRIKKKMDDNKATRVSTIYDAAVSKAQKGGIGHRMALLSTGDVAWQNIMGSWKSRARMLVGSRLTEKFANNADEMEKEREGVITSKERGEINKKLAEKNSRFNDLGHEIRNQEQVVKATPNDVEINKLKALKDQKISVGKEIQELKKSQQKKIDDKRAKELDDKIAVNRTKYKEYQLLEGSIGKANVMAELERQQGSKITHIDNAAELGQILMEAVKTGNKGLVAAVSKKMTRNGDYNEMLAAFGFGTGRQGMQDYAKLLQNKAGFTRDDSLSLLADIGHVAKGIKHFGGYGSVKMDKNGKWQETNEEEFNTMVLNEMNKMDYRGFAATNRLGVGQYIGGDHNPSTWQPLKAAMVFMKNNAVNLEQTFMRYGNANAAYHMIVHKHILEQNNVPAKLIGTLTSAGSPDEVGQLGVQVAGIKGIKDPDEARKQQNKKP